MPTELWAVAGVVVASVLAAAATFQLKRGARSTRLRLSEFHLDPRVLGAIALYLLSSVFFLLSLRGAQLSVLLPVTTLEYIWILLLAKRFLGEPIRPAKGVGVACIILGLVLVGLGS
ncbi:MAG: hypothetical protein ACE5IP_08560 [Terriglobia bacterium]